MCAIAGIAGTSVENAAGSKRIVESMLDLQKHRGPDGGAVLLAAGVALGHRRLAILDLTEQGRQPMTSRDGRWSLVFNGEVFNYRELKAQLDGPWHSTGDSEVLLEACARWGVRNTLDRVAGMFGLALWDHQRRELTLARDRFGEKPLVYYWDGRMLAFASELKALTPLSEKRLNPAAVDTYLALGYVPAPLAIYRDCGKLEAGTLLTLQVGGQPCTVSWWNPEPALRNRKQSPQSEQRADELRSCLGPAVRERLAADVPLALSLSGGIDSSVLAAESVRQGMTPAAFTVRFSGAGGTGAALPGDEDEVACASRVARHLGLRHEVLDAGHGQSFSDWVEHYDEPFADSSAVGALALARALGGRFKVILTGDGGDEAFAGYRHYEFIGIKQALKRAAAAVGMSDGTGAGDVYVRSKTIFCRRERDQLLTACNRVDGLRQLAETRAYGSAAGGALTQALWMDRYLTLASGLTYKMDIALGAFGIEGRAPFLDHRVMGWADQLPVEDLVRGRQKKILLRAAYRGLLPDDVLDRPKQGFGAPVARWLAGPLGDEGRGLLPCPLLSRFQPDGQLGRQAQRTAQKQWTLLMFSAWAKRWGAAW